MKRPSRTDDVVRPPVGRISVGTCHLVWWHSANLLGSVHWGRYRRSDAVDLTERLTGHRERVLEGVDVLTDARALESFEWSAWEVVMAHARGQLARWSRSVRRHAIVVPDAVYGTLLAGMLPILGATHSFRFFRAYGEATAWLDHPGLPAISDELRILVDSIRMVPPVVRALRMHLAQTQGHVTIESAARALGQSTRSLQRELRAGGTSFSEEVVQTRLQAVRSMLEETDASVEAIARRIGCGSPATLRALFTREVGETPLRYRLQRRSIASRLHVEATAGTG